MVEKCRSGGVDAVEEVEEVVVVADVGEVWTVAAVKTGRDKSKEVSVDQQKKRQCKGGTWRWRSCTRMSSACWK